MVTADPERLCKGIMVWMTWAKFTATAIPVMNASTINFNQHIFIKKPSKQLFPLWQSFRNILQVNSAVVHGQKTKLYNHWLAYLKFDKLNQNAHYPTYKAEFDIFLFNSKHVRIHGQFISDQMITKTLFSKQEGTDNYRQIPCLCKRFKTEPSRGMAWKLKTPPRHSTDNDFTQRVKKFKSPTNFSKVERWSVFCWLRDDLKSQACGERSISSRQDFALPPTASEWRLQWNQHGVSHHSSGQLRL